MYIFIYTYIIILTLYHIDNINIQTHQTYNASISLYFNASISLYFNASMPLYFNASIFISQCLYISMSLYISIPYVSMPQCCYGCRCDKILSRPLTFPSKYTITSEAKALIKQLLQREPSKVNKIK